MPGRPAELEHRFRRHRLDVRRPAHSVRAEYFFLGGRHCPWFGLGLFWVAGPFHARRRRHRHRFEIFWHLHLDRFAEFHFIIRVRHIHDRP